MKTVLVTGFEPFDGEPVNAAWEVVQTLSERSIEGAHLVIRQLPTVFGESRRALAQAMTEVEPDLVVCVGQAGGRRAVSVERIGVNMDDARIPDNAGQQPTEQPIEPSAPAGYFSTLPVRRIVEAVRERGIPAEESWSAGAYVCNHILFGLMHLLAQSPWRERGVRGGFIHIPFLPEQAVRHHNAPCLPKTLVAEALETAIRMSLCVSEEAAR